MIYNIYLLNLLCNDIKISQLVLLFIEMKKDPSKKLTLESLSIKKLI